MTASIVYCHGLPGTPQELSTLVPSISLKSVHALDRFRESEGSHERRVLAAFDAMGFEGPVAVAGFSLGAMSAAIIAAERSHLVRRLILISPAAPLQLGDFLPNMAGRPVFEAARRGKGALNVLTTMQAAAVAIAPNRVVAAMFRRSPAPEKRLIESADFMNVVVDGLRLCTGRYLSVYCSELCEYVQPWAGVLDNISCEIEIWQGTADDWTPPSMAHALKERLGGRAELNLCQDLGHYSTLLATAAQWT